MVGDRHRAVTYDMLAQFTRKPALFLDMMKRADAVISGSAALSIFFPSAFIPHDLDLYVASGNRDIVWDHLIYLGYQALTFEYINEDELHEKGDYDGLSLTDDHVFINGDSTIKLFIVSSGNAASPMLASHSTLLMNFISYYGIYCAYPRMTLNRRGLINAEDNVEEDDLPEDIASCITKYRARGFDFHRTCMTGFDTDKHRCGRSKECPGTLHILNDSGGLFWRFAPKKGARRESALTHYPGSSNTWMLKCAPLCTGLRNAIVRGFWYHVGLSHVVQ